MKSCCHCYNQNDMYSRNRAKKKKNHQIQLKHFIKFFFFFLCLFIFFFSTLLSLGKLLFFFIKHHAHERHTPSSLCVAARNNATKIKDRQNEREPPIPMLSSFSLRKKIPWGNLRGKKN